MALHSSLTPCPSTAAERINFDTYWKFNRGRSVILEGYQDEITTSKHKAVRTLVHKLQWLPYNERTEDNPERANYIAKLNAIAKQLLSTVKDYSGQLPKVHVLLICSPWCYLYGSCSVQCSDLPVCRRSRHSLTRCLPSL